MRMTANGCRLGFTSQAQVILLAGAIGLLSGCAASKKNDGSSGGRGGLFAGDQGTPWTILCLELEGVTRREYIEQFAEVLRKTPGVDAQAVFTRHDDRDKSQLYYGTYFRRTDPASGRVLLPEALRRDLRLIQDLAAFDSALPQPRRYFAAARIVRMPLPDVGNPQWDLTRAQGAYSLQVAAFEPTDEAWDYKSLAAEYCTWLRSRGYEAYYHHGPSCSIVTVGTFDESAVTRDPERPGMGVYSAAVRKLQQDDLLKYNRINGAIVRSRLVPSRGLSRWTGISNHPASSRGSSVPAAPLPSRLVPIPRQTGESEHRR